MKRDNCYIIASGKGGTGKTSLAAAIGLLLAQSGKRAALVDMDMGQRSLDIHLGLENMVVFDLYDVVRGVCRLKQAIISPVDFPGLSMISASQVRDAASLDHEKCAETVAALSDDNDLVLLDAPPGIGPGLKLAAACSRKAIMVVTPDAISIRDASRAINVMKELGVNEFYAVVNRVKPWQTSVDYDMNPALISEWLDAKLLATISESDKPDPLIGNAEVALAARRLSQDASLNWPRTELSLAQKILAAINRTDKRSSNAKSV